VKKKKKPKHGQLDSSHQLTVHPFPFLRKLVKNIPAKKKFKWLHPNLGRPKVALRFLLPWEVFHPSIKILYVESIPLTGQNIFGNERVDVIPIIISEVAQLNFIFFKSLWLWAANVSEVPQKVHIHFSGPDRLIVLHKGMWETIV